MPDPLLETIQHIVEAIDRIDGRGEWDYGICPLCYEEAELTKKGGNDVKKPAAAKKARASTKNDPWIPKVRLEYLPWARYCVQHQEAEERGRESA